ncbi:serine hydrolase domain-containing protein [Kitasatospora sp. NPDC101183]|uniref:serine hydrolase domain-containing protein n=1 Tax=Kitasatospora sp. NPDC101183 TaxID=3364100 RepID=UPI00382AC48A
MSRTRALGGRSAAALLAAFALLGTGTAASQAAPVPQGSAAETSTARTSAAQTSERTALQKSLQAFVDTGATAAVGEVRQDGRALWRGRAGVADLTTGEPVPAHARFRIGSVTKTFVATVVLQLAGERRLSLDDTVEHLLPGAVPNGGGITLRQLLNHSSGLVDYTDAPGIDPQTEEQWRTWLAGPRWHTYQPAELLALATARAPYFPPGQGWHYSNTNYLLAGMIIEKITGTTWQQEVDERVIQPLGLRDTTVPDVSPRVPGPHAHGYVKLSTGPVDITEFNPSVTSAAGRGISTAADLNRFVAALVGGELLEPAQLAEMERLTPGAPGGGYGMGLMRFDTPCGVFWGHTGGAPGYETAVAGSADGRRQFSLSVNPYDNTDADGGRRAFTTFLRTAACGPTG